MKFFKSIQCLLVSFVAHHVSAVDPTDSLMEGDPAQSNYLPNHNMDPEVVTGGSFGQIWHFTTPPSANGFPEEFIARSLVYTPSSTGRQVVISFSEQNKIYVLDAVNGTLYASRDLSLSGEPPFLVSDLGGCNDIPNVIGITGTPVVDPTTDTVYFWAKSYLGSERGWQNGAYYFHGVDAATLVERPGFPVNIQGQPSDNDATRVFTGGNVNQRASLTLINQTVYAGFSAHCDFFNYTGWIVGMSTNGDYVTSYTTSGGPGAQPQDGTWNGGGGGAGVWMGGSALASDGFGRIFFNTGNGFRQRDNGNNPASGRVHLDTLSECVVNMAIDPVTGKVTQQDYFEPYGYLAMDEGDRDLGSGGIVLPDSTVFNGTGVARMAIACGKNSQCYVVNRDNLGGYKLGPAGGDAIIQTITPPSGGAVFGNGATYPLEGGFYYISPVNSPIYVYSLGFSSTGVPEFTLASQTSDTSTGLVGIGAPTITTYKGQAGTAILWLVDPAAGLRAYYAVPQNGKMVKIPTPPTNTVAKFQRPVFGNGRYYLTSASGDIYGFGAPVSVPMNCDPIDFGSVLIGTYSTATATCTTVIPLNNITGLTLGKTIYQASNSSLPKGSIAAGVNFTFPVTLNLTAANAPGIVPGIQSSIVNIFTNNGVTGSATEASVSLTGDAISANPVIAVNPLQLDFPGLVVGSSNAIAGSADTFIISNLGQNSMKIYGYAYTNGTISADPVYTNVTTTNGVSVLDINGYFTAIGLPAPGTVIPGGGSVTVNALFNTTVIGDYYSTLTVFSNGGSAYTILTGTASTLPIALFEVSTNEGGWNTLGDCAVPANGCNTNIDMGTSPGLTISSVTIRFTNLGGSALIITKSKPPEGGVLFADNPDTDLSEGLAILPGDSATAAISFEPGPPILNSPGVYSAFWTLNTNDLNFGVHVVNFTGTVITNKTGPILPNGQARYQYLGCYQDNTALRIESKGYVNTGINTNGLCQNQSLAYGAVFAGTEYQQECWVGSVIPSPSLLLDDSQCNYQCVGDATQTCGGYATTISLYYDSTRYFPDNGTIIGASGKGPAIVPTVGTWSYLGCYTDSAAARGLSSKFQSTPDATLESCAAFCTGYQYFGAEFGVECYCGNALATTSTVSPATSCIMLCGGNNNEFCGDGNQLSVYSNNANLSLSSTSSMPSASTTTTFASGAPSSTVSVPALSTGISYYTYVTCWTDSTSARSLSAIAETSYTMTVEICSSFCAGYIYFGVEFGRECYCANSLSGGSIATDGRCNMACLGNANEICGGSNGLSLYEYSAYYSKTSSVTTTSATTSSSLSVSKSSSSSTSSASSSSSASADTPSSSTSVSTTSTSPPTLSTGLSYYTYVACWTDNTNARTLAAKTETSYSMTVEMCASFCGGYIYFGVEFGRECYCDNSLLASSTIATDGRCNMACLGNSTEICGGSNGLSLYEYSAYYHVTTSVVSSSSTVSSRSSTLSVSPSTSQSSTSSSSSSLVSPTPSPSSTSSTSLTSSSKSSTIVSTSTATSSSSSSTSSKSSTSSSASATPTYTNWSSLGCFNDTSGTRALNGASTSTSTNTVESCLAYCLAAGYPMAGVEYSSQCFCGAGVFNWAKSGQTGCTMACSGNAGEICGGSSRINIYNYTAPFTKPVLPPTIGAYNLQGCFVDSTASRGLSSYSFSNGGAMTNELCINTCSSKGYALAGTEFGDECYCGNALASTSSPALITDCEALLCPGNSTEFCSAGNRLLVYSSGA